MHSWSVGGDAFVPFHLRETLLALYVKFNMAAQRLACLGLNVLHSTFCAPTQVLSFPILHVFYMLCVLYDMTIIKKLVLYSISYRSNWH